MLIILKVLQIIKIWRILLIIEDMYLYCDFLSQMPMEYKSNNNFR